MTRFYTKPMLLIEFDANKPFALQGKYYLSRDVASSDLTTRLQLLTMHFPKLRILWSPSPHATAELFEEVSPVNACSRINATFWPEFTKTRGIYNNSRNLQKLKEFTKTQGSKKKPSCKVPQAPIQRRETLTVNPYLIIE